MRRPDNFLKLFSSDPENSRFSSDDRCLVVHDKHGIQVFDLARGQIGLDLRPLDVRGLEFEARNTILKVQLPDSVMLIPLDRALMERFAKWLAVQRKWTLSERCMYGLDEGGEECRKALIAPGAQSTSSSKLVKEISP